MDAHLGYGKHDPAGRDGGNSRNGHRGKMVLADVGGRPSKPGAMGWEEGRESWLCPGGRSPGARCWSTSLRSAPHNPGGSRGKFVGNTGERGHEAKSSRRAGRPPRRPGPRPLGHAAYRRGPSAAAAGHDTTAHRALPAPGGHCGPAPVPAPRLAADRRPVPNARPADRLPDRRDEPGHRRGRDRRAPRPAWPSSTASTSTTTDTSSVSQSVPSSGATHCRSPLAAGGASPGTRAPRPATPRRPISPLRGMQLTGP